MILYYFFLITIIIYLILHFIFLIGYFRSSNVKISRSPLPSVSVIVAARNEEKIISACIASLKNLKYDFELLEIILVNDNSTDNTKNIMLLETKGFRQFKVIDSNNSSGNNLKGKPNAIDTAINISSGEIILMSDADCLLPPDWIYETVKYYEGNTGMVCGITRIKYENSIFAKLQALDWLYLQSLACCSSGIGKILSCIGNNLSFTKIVYRDIGGFRNINFSVTEDLALARAIDSNKNYKIKSPVNPGCLVVTDECKSLKELYNQKKRWFKGGFDINYLGWIMGFELYFTNIFFVTGYLFFNFDFYISQVLIKIFSELLIMVPIYIKLKFKNLIFFFPAFQLYFAIYGLLLPFTFLFGKNIKWKDRKL